MGKPRLNILGRAAYDLNSGCALWPGAMGAEYGVVNRGKRNIPVHRVAYCEANGLELEDIKGWVIRHKCDTPLCVNPQHLLIGTNADNVRDKVERGRVLHGADAWHTKLTEEIVREIRRRYKRGHPVDGQTAMAREFGVSAPSVCLIVSGKNWKYLKD
jgi:hypothetical protein